ncbi:MAG: Hsp20/alpha crystallin family protein [Leptospiraceae bacterium]|nr:Hsp20/alpha crystallin family protein [Leptospiraceae bacterium]
MFWNDWYGWQRNLWDLAQQGRAGNVRRSYPGIKLYAGENEALIRAEVPGVKTEDLELEVQDEELSIRLKREAAQGEALRNERPHGEYEKVVRLPFRANPEKVSADLRAGVLNVRLERALEDRPRKIAVAVS